MRSLETVYELFGNNTGTHTVFSPIQIWHALFITIYLLILVIIVLIFDTHFKRKSKFKYDELAKTIPKNDWSAMETLERRMKEEFNFLTQLWVFFIWSMYVVMFLLIYFLYGW